MVQREARPVAQARRDGSRFERCMTRLLGGGAGGEWFFSIALARMLALASFFKNVACARRTSEAILKFNIQCRETRRNCTVRRGKKKGGR